VVHLASIPSPTQGVWHIGSIPIRAYALCIVLGIIAACIITDIRLRRRGAPPYAVLDVAVWAVPAGIIGARLYHVITSPSLYFGDGGNFVDAFKIWQGGLGIWGGVAGGTVGAWIAARRLGLPLTMTAFSFIGIAVTAATIVVGTPQKKRPSFGETLKRASRIAAQPATRAQATAAAAVETVPASEA